MMSCYIHLCASKFYNTNLNVKNMKKSIYFTGFLGLLSLAALTGCDSNKEKTEKAELNLSEAKAKATSDSLNLVSVEEWTLFKNETESKIKEHEIRISFLKKSIKQSSPKTKKELNEKIESLEKDNQSLKNRLETYEKVKSDWITFKREFSHDMDQLGSALKDFTIPSK